MAGLELSGKAAFVTGAASGIGAAVVARLLEEGARVVGFDRAASGAASGGGSSANAVRVIAGDVTKSAEVVAALQAAKAELGRLEVVVHCAGVTDDAVVWKLDDARWRRVVETNLDGSFHVVRAAIPLLRAEGGGSIVLIASILGLRGGFGSSSYAASKAGVIALAKSAAAEAGAFGVRVNAVAPGYIQTPMTASLPPAITEMARQAAALGRLGEAGEVADAILFLASPLSRYVTGTCLRVDGGQCMGY